VHVYAFGAGGPDLKERALEVLRTQVRICNGIHIYIYMCVCV